MRHTDTGADRETCEKEVQKGLGPKRTFLSEYTYVRSLTGKKIGRKKNYIWFIIYQIKISEGKYGSL